jgi:ubiquinone/menaquinone biosynthesis C-methylase UbiE
MSQDHVNDTVREWGETAKYWVRHSDLIRVMFAPLTRTLMEDARIVHGQRVLDVAGGAGEPSLTIAATVGPAGSVTCTDAVEEMVNAARAEAGRRGLGNIEFRCCTADSLPFPDDSFDAVVSRLGAMFFPEPLGALREMLRVSKPNGRVALAVWHRSDLNPFCYIVSEAMSRYVETPPSDPDAPGAFRFAEPGKLAGILKAAGAIDVNERILEFKIEAPLSPEEFWEMRSETSESLRSKLTTLTAEQALQVAREVEAEVREFFPNNQMSFPAKMLIVSGTKP